MPSNARPRDLAATDDDREDDVSMAGEPSIGAIVLWTLMAAVVGMGAGVELTLLTLAQFGRLR